MHEPLGQKLILAATSDLPPGTASAIAHGKYHRIEYLELANLHRSPWFDYSHLKQSYWRKVEEWMKLDFTLAAMIRKTAHRRRARVILCFSERIAIPLALLRPQAKIVVLAHNPFSRTKYPLIARLAGRWDRIILFSQAEAIEFARRIPGTAQKIRIIPPAIDTDFYKPSAQALGAGVYAFSIGRMHRDYQTLVRAFELLPHELCCRVCATSLWTKGEADFGRQVLPLNVSLCDSIDPFNMREEIYRSRFLIIPINLRNNGWNDGCTSVTLAGAMGKPVIATDTPGLAELVLNGETGLLVPPQDAQALAAAVHDLWQRPEIALEMGRRARIRAENAFSYEVWLSRISEVLYEVAI